MPFAANATCLRKMPPKHELRPGTLGTVMCIMHPQCLPQGLCCLGSEPTDEAKLSRCRG